MGTSHPETKPWIVDRIEERDIRTVLDIGAGSGTYADHFRAAGLVFDAIDAVEVWNPYINQYRLHQKYDHVYNMDARMFYYDDYDLVIFGDVMEHMPVEDAKAIWAKVSLGCKHAVIAIPIITYHQHAINGNPYEEHVTPEWNPQLVIDTFPGITDHAEFSITGAFWADFEQAPLRDTTI